MPVGFGSGVEQFQAGRALAGENAVGTFIKGLLGQVNKLQETQFEAQAKAGAELSTQRQLLELIRGPQGVTQPGQASGAPVVTGAKIAGLDVEFPEAQAQLEAQKTLSRERAQRQAKTGSYARSLAGSLARISQLSRQIPAPEAGGGRIFQEIGTRYRGFTQELPQVAQVDQERKAIAGQIVQVIGGESSSRLSDQDVQRVLGLLQNPPGDTIQKRALSTVEIIDAINAIPEVQAEGGIDISTIMTPEEIELGRRLQGRILQPQSEFLQ